MTKNNILYLITFIAILCFQSCTGDEKQRLKKPNILFISIDDLRPELGAYGNDIVKSPNIDQIANQGFTFLNHFVQVPTCGASRAAMLTGLYPLSQAHLRNSIFEKEISYKEETERPETFIHHLKRNGYYTAGIGKISHSADGLVYGYEEAVSDQRELPHSWDDLSFNTGKWKTGWNAFFAYADGSNRQSKKKQVPPYEKGIVNDEGYPDGLTTELAISKLEELKEKNQPFFLGVGFFKPHLPFNAPEKYWDLYEREEFMESETSFIPQNINRKSLHNSGEFNGYQKGDEKANLDNSVSQEYAQKLKHGYYACVSYIDEQVGAITNKLSELGLDENTIIVIWGDHGWHLGDQLVWGKHTIFENALKSALIIKVPGHERKGSKVKSIVESTDIYPTLMELTGTEMPYESDGESLLSLMNGVEDSKRVAYGYFRQGISLRTSNYRLSKYFREEEPKIELYDHEKEQDEAINIAHDSIDLVKRLMPLLELGNTGLYDD